MARLVTSRSLPGDDGLKHLCDELSVRRAHVQDLVGWYTVDRFKNQLVELLDSELLSRCKHSLVEPALAGPPQLLYRYTYMTRTRLHGYTNTGPGVRP